MRSLRQFFAGLTALILLAIPSTLLGDGANNKGLRLTSPLDYQVIQRTSRAKGTILVAGDWEDSAKQAGSVEVRLLGVGTPTEWRELTKLRANTTNFSAELKAPSGGWYRLEVRVKAASSIVGDASVEHVGVGEIFVIAGQSNSANHGEEKQQTTTKIVAAFDGNKWQLAHDPQPGASGGGGSSVPPFADAMVERFKVPVGIIATGVGATSVREWLPRGTRFPNPPTLTGQVTQLASGGWESKGVLFDNLVGRMKSAGSRGFRAVLWHQGESDANQRDASRTLPGEAYGNFLGQLIRDSRLGAGWEVPWFVAQVSYHTPDDTGSPDIRAAQEALWKSGVALEGPDSDAMTGDLRESGGKGVHFSGKGLREHGKQWAAKVSPWLEKQLAGTDRKPGTQSRLDVPDTENITVAGRPAFIFLPPAAKRTTPQPWIFYAPTLNGLPDEAERWMHEQFLDAGIAVAGVDVGEAYGSPASHKVFDALYTELTRKHGFGRKPCLLGRSRGGLAVSSWAIANPRKIAGIAGIYPVFDFRTYPGITNAAPAYGLSPAKLAANSARLNPIERVQVLARAKVPTILIHGDVDTVVPLKENSAEWVSRYNTSRASSLVQLIVLPGQGHNYFEGFFHSQPLVDFAIAHARAGAHR